ncbi:hypothetical protein [Ideonella livida]|uniref:DUF2945 domain-containing protein n=1 Tax=Ideonella livida TaxID=2707176 RepID=A0A7C9TJM4_9BURK|nr:hypothetical protein [Ideonella livida]NDY89746.1 hypothetical protein [Ideonella livida]
MSFKVGDSVSWSSQAQGSTKQKFGEVVAVVPVRGAIPDGFQITGAGSPRDHESYIVAVKSGKTDKAKLKLYWPRVNALCRVAKRGKVAKA